MSFVGLFGKRTWLGLASAVAALLLCVMLGALLVVKGALPSGMTVWWVYGSCGLAAFLGGCMARKGGGEAVLSLITAALLYALLWCVALASSQPVDFKVTACGSPARCLAAVFSRVCCAVEKSGKSRPNGKRLRR